ncbi:hypothetical protein [Celeribacter halophilus]|uniref:hypothetical protein n=1 Tax=Celeribacter halophilus TaxID=576117 RepID=UPI003A8D435B
MSGHVYAHSMWRTGSTALARRFLDSTDYLVFYEPFHEVCGSGDRLLRAQKVRQSPAEKLRHPEWIGGYFDNFLLKDPKTGKPLYELYDPSCAVRSVYHKGPTQHALDYIEACKRVANEQGKNAFLGFCRSGMQQQSLKPEAGETAFYLYREPRSQFLSYDYPNNDYMIPGTLFQLAHSSELRPYIREILTQRYRLALLDVTRTLGKRGPMLTSYRWARLLARDLDMDEAYRLFFLSYEVSRRTAQRAGYPFFSIDSLCGHDRARFEETYGISLDGLHPNTRELHDTERYTSMEQDVLCLLGDYLM